MQCCDLDLLTYGLAWSYQTLFPMDKA